MRQRVGHKTYGSTESHDSDSISVNDALVRQVVDRSFENTGAKVSNPFSLCETQFLPSFDEVVFSFSVSLILKIVRLKHNDPIGGQRPRSKSAAPFGTAVHGKLSWNKSMRLDHQRITFPDVVIR